MTWAQIWTNVSRIQVFISAHETKSAEDVINNYDKKCLPWPGHWTNLFVLYFQITLKWKLAYKIQSYSVGTNFCLLLLVLDISESSWFVAQTGLADISLLFQNFISNMITMEERAFMKNDILCSLWQLHKDHWKVWKMILK